MIAKIEMASGHDRTAREIRNRGFGVQRVDGTDHEACVDGVLAGLRGIESVF